MTTVTILDGWLCPSCGTTYPAAVARHPSGPCVDCWRG